MTDEDPVHEKWTYTTELIVILNMVIPIILSVLFYYTIMNDIENRGMINWTSNSFIMFDIYMYFYVVMYSMVLGAVFYKRKKIFYTFFLMFPLFFYLLPTLLVSTFNVIEFVQLEPVKVLIMMIVCLLFELLGVLIRREVLLLN